MKIKPKLLFLALLWFSCDKEDPAPKEYTLDTSLNRGFSFESMEIIDYTSTGPVKPDFIVLAQVNLQGDVLYPFLSHPDYVNRFLLSDEFQNIEEAQAYYDTYTVPETSPLQVTANNVKPFQVWLVKTNSGGYGKLLVIDTEFGKRNDVPFAEIVFKAAKMQ